MTFSPYAKWQASHWRHHATVGDLDRRGSGDFWTLTKEEYLEAHRNTWPELLKVLRDSGVEREIIWIQGNTLYIYVMAEDFDKAIAQQGKEKVFADWLKKMEPLLDVIQDYSEEGKVMKLEKIFDMEEQLARLEKQE